MIAPLLVWRRGEDDFLLLTEPELGEVVRAHLTRMRFAAKCEIELEEHASTIVLGGAKGSRTATTACPAVEVLDADLDAEPADDELERLRILARTPRWGREIDDRVLPAEAGPRRARDLVHQGLLPRPGAGRAPALPRPREPHAARARGRRRAARARDEVAHDGKVVGRVTSAVPGLALAYVRVEVPDDAELDVGGRPARLH